MSQNEQEKNNFPVHFDTKFPPFDLSYDIYTQIRHYYELFFMRARIRDFILN